MTRWISAHFLMAASHMALEDPARAESAARACREFVPGAMIAYLNRFPLKDSDRMDEFQAWLRAAGLND